MNRDEVETAPAFEPVQLYELIERRRVQIRGQRGWYDIRCNGALKRWKRDANRVEIPCKIGFRECFRLCGTFIDGRWQWSEQVRETPADFDPRKRI
jgi:hypothetical protein